MSPLAEAILEIDRLRDLVTELLAALEGLDDDGCYADCKNYGLGKKHSAACDAVRHAIAKAKGE